MRYFVTLGSTNYTISLHLIGGNYHATVEGEDGTRQEHQLESHATDVFRVDNQILNLHLNGDGRLSVNGRYARASAESERERAFGDLSSSSQGEADGTVVSPMPGKVVKVLTQVGDEVEAGTAVIVVEAMKMENELAAPNPGVVKQVLVGAGDAVEAGAKLIVIE